MLCYERERKNKRRVSAESLILIKSILIKRRKQICLFVQETSVNGTLGLACHSPTSTKFFGLVLPLFCNRKLVTLTKKTWSE